MNKKKGFFLTFEGPEASGKSSQIKLLEKFLKNQKIPYHITREPGGTHLAESLRSLILRKNLNINIEEEILMLMAARSHHINQVIKPAIKKGKIVISDRFADSTFVYQGYLNGFGINSAKKLHKDLLNNFLPNKTFLFNLNPKEIIKRLKKRKVKNKYDKNDLLFHKKISLGYKIISKNQKRFINIDATKDKKFIHKVIIENLGF